jgi:hypothetical protein
MDAHAERFFADLECLLMARLGIGIPLLRAIAHGQTKCDRVTSCRCAASFKKESRIYFLP